MSIARPKPPHFHAAKNRTIFGYTIMGPVLADMLLRLYVQLHSTPTSVVFFCSRGGLVLRRALDIFTGSVGLELQVPCRDFMVSRLTAFRAAFQLDPRAVAPLIDIEFAGRTCAQAVNALWDIEITGARGWNVPFSLERLLQLTQESEVGLQIQTINDHQVLLLRDHIDDLRGTNRHIVLCDTGVFGSILRYLSIGVPAFDWRLVVLFRANYKRISAPHFDCTTGVVSESDIYLPWKSPTAALLYWPLIEAMLEPALPTVRCYRREPVGRVTSNLEIPFWTEGLDPAGDSLLGGAYEYLSDLTPASLSAVTPSAQRAWRKLHRMIAFPKRQDVELLQVGPRNLDFGTDESVHFTSSREKTGRSLREKISIASESVWPEGELRKQLPTTASPVLVASELWRWVRVMRGRGT